MIEFSVLGPLGVHEQGCSYTPTAPKQRQLLALLLLNANQVVSTDTCIEELWENSPPNTSLSTLQSYILQLRRKLRQIPHIGSLRAAHNILETRDNGYLMVVEGEGLDAAAFVSLARKGRDLLNRDDVAASSLLAKSLRIWRGSALSDVQTGPVTRSHLVGLEEERASVQEQRIDADLRLGRHQELLGELSSLTTKHPMHEQLHGQLMLALYRSGRRTQSLEVVRRLGKTLRTELGIEPSPQIHQLHQAILACDPLIDFPRPVDESPFAQALAR